MKKILVLISTAVVLMSCLTSCNKNEDEIISQDQQNNYTTVGINKDEIVVPPVL